MKTFWQKVKLLIISNFSFCHNVLKKSSPADAPESVCMWESVNIFAYRVLFYVFYDLDICRRKVIMWYFKMNVNKVYCLFLIVTIFPSVSLRKQTLPRINIVIRNSKRLHTCVTTGGKLRLRENNHIKAEAVLSIQTLTKICIMHISLSRCTFSGKYLNQLIKSAFWIYIFIQKTHSKSWNLKRQCLLWFYRNGMFI